MATKVPVVRETRWLMMVPPLGTLGVLYALAMLAFDGAWWAGLVGAGIWCAYTFTARGVWLRHHRAGMKALRAERWEEAIESYQRGEALLRERPWIDRWRPLTLMTASGMSFTEIAVNNIAFAQSQSDQPERARQTYERGLAEFPDSYLMRTALRMLDAGAAAQAAGAADSNAEPPAA